MNKFGWMPVFEKSNIVGLEKGKANISLEPGGQFELSGAIKKTVHFIHDIILQNHTGLGDINLSTRR